MSTHTTNWRGWIGDARKAMGEFITLAIERGGRGWVSLSGNMGDQMVASPRG